MQCRVFHATIKAPLDTASSAATASMGMGRESAVEAVVFGRRCFKYFLPPRKSRKQILWCQLQSQYVCFWTNVRVCASVCQPARVCMQTLNLLWAGEEQTDCSYERNDPLHSGSFSMGRIYWCCVASMSLSTTGTHLCPFPTLRWQLALLCVKPALWSVQN